MGRNTLTSIHDRFRKPAQYYQIPRENLLDLLPAGARRILDVGCGAGVIWRDFEGEAWGIELNEEAAELARGHMKVICGDVTKVEFPFPEAHFDCILFADVLEHVYDPWDILLRLRPYVAPTGHILISIPNVRYYKVVRNLLFRADFAYARSGVLDIDHVRFFARKNVEWMVTGCGYEITRLDRIKNASFKYRLLNRLLFGAADDFLTRQYLVLAKPDPQWSPPESAS